MNKILSFFMLVLLSVPVLAEETTDIDALQISVDELRAAQGKWGVVTEFLNPDGSVAKSVTGNYEFNWVVPDRILSGQTNIPELQQTSAILFYINAKDSKIEMVSVGPDGKLWIMTGALGGDQRMTQEYATPDGGSGQLRFTRYNVKEDSFESKMEYTSDGGETWVMGNHQLFKRAKVE